MVPVSYTHLDVYKRQPLDTVWYLFSAALVRKLAYVKCNVSVLLKSITWFETVGIKLCDDAYSKTTLCN